MNVRLTIEYNGAKFAGWQRQPGVRTVQSELEAAVTTVLASAAKKARVSAIDDVSLTGSGRTDTGVHAFGQVVSFLWPDQVPLEIEPLLRSLNGITESDIRVLDAVIVADDFDARRTPHMKQYRYRMRLASISGGVEDDRVWCVPPGLDIAEMLRAAKLFEGKHNFSAFRAADCSSASTVRWVKRSELTRVSSNELVYNIVGSGFLKQMVRIIVGTLVEVGKGKMNLTELEPLIDGGARAAAGATAPAHALSMINVTYSER